MIRHVRVGVEQNDKNRRCDGSPSVGTWFAPFIISGATERVVNHWNRLSAEEVMAPSLSKFVECVDDV